MNVPTPAALDDLLTARLLHQRMVVLTGDLDDDAARRATAQLLLLAAEDPTGQIAMYISSPGGSVTAGLSLYDTLRMIPAEVTTVGHGLVASPALLLLAAGAPGSRRLLPHTRVVLHQPAPGLGVSGAGMATRATDTQHASRALIDLLAQHTGRTTAQVADDVGQGHHLDAREAVAYGLADSVVAAVDDVRPASRSRPPVR